MYKGVQDYFLLRISSDFEKLSHFFHSKIFPHSNSLTQEFNFIFKFHHKKFVIAYFVFVVLAMFFLSTNFFFVKFYRNESIFKIIIIFIKFFTKIIFNSFNIFIFIYLKNEKLIFFVNMFYYLSSKKLDKFESQ